MAERKDILFIVNPVSGTSGKNFVLKLIEDYLDKGLYDYEVAKTEHVGHATELAKDAAQRGMDMVCAIGGDGTVNEVASGLVHTQTALAIIPSGSGNGLARHLRIPTDPLSAIKIINRGIVQMMDYGIVNKRPFFCTCGVGFDAFISQRFAESGKRGPISYLENVLNSSLNYHPETYEIDIINNKEGKEVHEKHKAFLISYFVYQLSPVFMGLPGVKYAKKKKLPLFILVCDIWPESLKMYIQKYVKIIK